MSGAIAYVVLERQAPGRKRLQDVVMGRRAAVAAAAGFLLPSLALGRMIDQRNLAITNALPDVLDLLIVCLEAGCALDQAFVKVAEELSIAYPAIGEELKMLSTETRAGKPRMEA